MKNTLIYITALALCQQIAVSQILSEEAYKYWYYRDRLQHFVYPSAYERASVLMTVRNSNGNGAQVGEGVKNTMTEVNAVMLSIADSGLILSKSLQCIETLNSIDTGSNTWVKIEELTLYMLQLKKENEELRQLIESK